MAIATVSSRGWVVIPKEYRDKYDLRPGSKVEIVEQNGIVLVIPIPEDPLEALDGFLAGQGSLTAELIAERVAEREREERKVHADLRA